MKKWDIPLKVAFGYTFIIVVFGMAVILVYGYTRSAVRLSDVERAMTVRWDAAGSLVYSILEVENLERAVCMGDVGQWDAYERAISRTQAYADSLSVLLDDTVQRARIDSLQMLLDCKRDNTRRLIAVIGTDGAGKVYRRRAERLRNGLDSVVVSSDVSRGKDEKHVTYVVNRTGKTFFSRLADVFRRSRSDTTLVTVWDHHAGIDTMRQVVNLSDTLAEVLTGVGREEERLLRARTIRIKKSARALQITGIELAHRTDKLLESISRAERRWLRHAGEADMSRRTAALTRMGLLSAVAVLLALVSLFFVCRDNRRAVLYRHRLEEAREQAERLLEQRERLMLTITHDIKSPVASISGFIELLRTRISDPKAVGWLDVMRSSAAHLLQLVGALLDYHQLEKGGVCARFVSFSPSTLIANCVESFRTRADAKGLMLICKTIDGVTDLSASSATEGKKLYDVCRGDAFRIRQIAENLISNALKYTAKGCVTVAVGVTEGILRLSVADTGPGMTEEDSRRVFTAFTRLSGAQDIEGVGLGLSITRELVTLLGGEITLDTTPGHGSTFTVCLPVETGPAAGEAPALSSSPSLTCCAGALPQDLSIVIIDDDPFQLQLVCEMLRGMSGGRWRICACSQTEELLVLLDERHFDIMFTDIEMPGTNGFELLRRLGCYRLPTVAMTAHDAISDDEFLKAGFAARLSKPFNTENLYAVISRLMGCYGEYTEVEADSPTISVYGRFAPLVEFADGDRDAEIDILRQFRLSTAEHLEAFRGFLDNASEDIYTCDGSLLENVSSVAALGHKLIPVFTMIQSPAVTHLKALSAMRGSSVNGHVAGSASCLSVSDFRNICGDIVCELEAILNELDRIIV